jgi:hypothetical protein
MKRQQQRFTGSGSSRNWLHGVAAGVAAGYRNQWTLQLAAAG